MKYGMIYKNDTKIEDKPFKLYIYTFYKNHTKMKLLDALHKLNDSYKIIVFNKLCRFLIIYHLLTKEE